MSIIEVGYPLIIFPLTNLPKIWHQIPMGIYQKFTFNIFRQITICSHNVEFSRLTFFSYFVFSTKHARKRSCWSQRLWLIFRQITIFTIVISVIWHFFSYPFFSTKHARKERSFLLEPTPLKMPKARMMVLMNLPFPVLMLSLTTNLLKPVSATRKASPHTWR